MANDDDSRKKRRQTEFKLNEPATRIPGGARRKSTRIPRGGLRPVGRRERLNELLLAHDPEDAERALAEITDDDQSLLRQIAREGAITGVTPRLRQNAIAALARFPTQDNLNLLTELAQHGEDFYVRSHALVALGQTGVALAAPVLRERLGASEPLEVSAAERGLEALARSAGPEVVRAAFVGESRKAIAERGKLLIERLEAKPGTRRAPRGKTTGQPPTSRK
ncbi:MAG: HEAT repeat domain-containing protein [Actinomycetota bacterium]|nr:HEAT repeat domain-containing protein [Actinomycetota bacterium]